MIRVAERLERGLIVLGSEFGDLRGGRRSRVQGTLAMSSIYINDLLNFKRELCNYLIN